MPEHRPPRRWALVADGTRAQIIDLSSAPGTAERIEGFVFRNDHRHLRRLLSDVSGHAIARLRSGENPAGKGVNLIRADDREFLDMVLRAVQERAEANEFDLLVLVADAYVLDAIKTLMPNGLLHRIEREVQTDMACLPRSSIRRELLRLMQSSG